MEVSQRKMEHEGQGQEPEWTGGVTGTRGEEAEGLRYKEVKKRVGGTGGGTSQAFRDTSVGGFLTGRQRQKTEDRAGGGRGSIYRHS